MSSVKYTLKLGPNLVGDGKFIKIVVAFAIVTSTKNKKLI
jgi:hypothetical protein